MLVQNGSKKKTHWLTYINYVTISNQYTKLPQLSPKAQKSCSSRTLYNQILM